MRIDIGTSGYGYKEWLGSFYPPTLKPAAMLAHYAQKLSTVEINYTFRRMPTETLLAGWAAQVPESFTFVLKAPAWITERAKLKNVGPMTASFVAIAQTLGPRLGALLFKIPPDLEKDVALLRAFLELLGESATRATFDFRHPSWFEDDAVAALRDHGAALCLSEVDDAPAGDDVGAPLITTAGWGYVRLRKTDYSDRELVAWSKRLRAQPWSRAFVFFMHEDEANGPRFALRLREILEAA